MQVFSFMRVRQLTKYFFYASFVGMSLLFEQARAAYSTTTGAGSIANDMMEPVGLFSNMMNAGCIILGTSFLFASIVKYFEHKRSPLMVTMSTVVFLFIGGVLLLSVPLFSYFYARSHGIDI
jgi:hypothetical protein